MYSSRSIRNEVNHRLNRGKAKNVISNNLALRGMNQESGRGIKLLQIGKCSIIYNS